MSMSKCFRVYHKPDPPYSVLLECRNNEETLIFESGVIAALSSTQTEVIKKAYTKYIDAYGCLGVLTLPSAREFPSTLLALVTSCVSVGRIGETDIYRISGVSFVSLQNCLQDEERVSELKKFLSAGTFYYSWSSSTEPVTTNQFDLSICAQKHFDLTNSDDRFFWNKLFHVPLRHYGINWKSWLLKVMCGGVEIRTVYAAQKQGKACLISRLSCERAGTRFNVRGTNDEGHVANFVETEQVIYIEDTVCSFLQTRGSVPLFWEQPGFQVGSHKVRMSRGYEASAPAFERHLSLQKQIYGQQVLVNLLGSKGGEHALTQAFKSHHDASKEHNTDIPLVTFDYHQECRGGSLKNLQKLRDILKKYINEFGFFSSQGLDVMRTQAGCIRTNCLDCLDRTNSVQTLIGLEILNSQLETLGLANKPQMKSRFEEVYKNMWTLNGDHISRIYAGTGALGGGRSKAQDAARSANRTIQNNFLDNMKQEAIDLLLHGANESVELSDRVHTLYDSLGIHLPSLVLRKAVENFGEYSGVSNVRISVGTWNVNGGKHFRSIAFKHEHVTDWLLDLPTSTAQLCPEMLLPDVDYSIPSDIFAIGFEEIVDLNAGNIVSASTQNQKDWGIYLQKNISREHKYIILSSSQLVGVCLFIFVRPFLAPYIKNLGVVSVKTGLGGATGNKGAVAIRFQLYNSSICFVCSHFAAGQSNVRERNSDFQDIANKIIFPLGKKVWHHDHLFWCGDFNYRIDLGKEEVKDLITQKNWSALQACDQLNVQRSAGNVFQGFNEGPTNFAPTYKYDLFCDDYDTSEKCRVPAWTDRVLWVSKSASGCESVNTNNCKLLLYNKSELKTSDHRPVMAIFDVPLLKCDPEKRKHTLKQCILHYGPPDCSVIVDIISEDVSIGNDGEEEDILEDSLVDAVLEVLGEAGEIILVRFTSNSSMCLTYRTGLQTLKSLHYNNHQVANKIIHVHLQNPNWIENLEDELKEAGRKTLEVSRNDGNSEDFVSDESSILLSFHCDDDEDDEVSNLMKESTNDLQSRDVSKTPDFSFQHPASTNHCPQIPPRMAITPTQSLQSNYTVNPTLITPLLTSNVSSTSLSDDMVPTVDKKPSKEDDTGSGKVHSDSPVDSTMASEQKKVKPPRPAALPSRPPPPKFTNQNSSSIRAAHSPMGVSKQVSTTHIVKPVYANSYRTPQLIGLPTNVTRTGAKSVEEAEKLIGQLMSKNSSGNTFQSIDLSQSAHALNLAHAPSSMSKSDSSEPSNETTYSLNNSKNVPPIPNTPRPNIGIKQDNIATKQTPVYRNTVWYDNSSDLQQSQLSSLPCQPSQPAEDLFLPPPSALPPILSEAPGVPPPIPKNRPVARPPPVPAPRRFEQQSRDDDEDECTNKLRNDHSPPTSGLTEVTAASRPLIPARPAPVLPPAAAPTPPLSEAPSLPPAIPARTMQPPAIPPRHNI